MAQFCSWGKAGSERASQSQARGRRQACTGIKCSQCSSVLQISHMTVQLLLPLFHVMERWREQGSPCTSHTLPFIPARLRPLCYGAVAQTAPLKVYSINYQALRRETNRQQTNSNYLVSLHQNTLAIAARWVLNNPNGCELGFWLKHPILLQLPEATWVSGALQWRASVAAR